MYEIKLKWPNKNRFILFSCIRILIYNVRMRGFVKKVENFYFKLKIIWIFLGHVWDFSYICIAKENSVRHGKDCV